mmetsp:Transcript_3759/g.5475  ORF Transcript_3759/g.5475 Transcript_3759/m.5475 type:complete len:123 (+) Transcript_3759:1695-2063(+)
MLSASLISRAPYTTPHTAYGRGGGVFIFQVCVDVCVVHHVCDDGVPGGLLLLPSQRGGGGVTDLQRVYNGRPEEDEEGNAPSHYGASVVRLFPRTNPIHVDMDVPMENKWRSTVGYQLAVYQ